MGYVGMRVGNPAPASTLLQLIEIRIVEYATREQAQQAVNTLSNQNLMGRLVYVREVRPISCPYYTQCISAYLADRILINCI